MAKHKSNGQPQTVRQRRVAKHEAAARAAGHVGPFPQRVPIVKSAEDCQSLLVRLEDGEHRASVVSQIGKNIIAFYGQLSPDVFRRFARTLVKIAHDSKTAARVKLRAVEAAVKPLTDAVELLARLQRGGNPKLVEHLQACIASFAAEFTEAEMRSLADVLTKLTAARGPETSSTRIRAVQTALKLAMGTADAFARFQAMVARDEDEMDPNDPRLIQAERELKVIQAEIRDANEPRLPGPPGLPGGDTPQNREGQE